MDGSVESASRPARRAGLAMSLLAAIVAGISIAPAAGAVPSEETAKARITWTGCGQRVECARVRVPLRWSHPHGRKIALAVIRHLASQPERRIGSLFWNPGGPGGSLDRVKNDGERLDVILQGRFDVVGWDLRGTGESTRVRCFRSEELAQRFFHDWALPFTTASSRRTVREMASLARRCHALSGDLLAHISTSDTVRDLDHLRRLVGDPQLSYWGWSAGTLIGQTYANMFPGRVRAMALDGLVDPVSLTKGTAAWLAGSLFYADKAFAGFLSLCDAAGPARCALAGHGSSAAARAGQVLADLRRGPIAAKNAKPPGDLTYGDALAGILDYLSAGPSYWPAMAEAFNAAAGGDGSDLAIAGRLVTSAFSSTVMAPGLPGIALICADSPARQGPAAWRRVIDRVTRVSFIYGPVTGWWRWAPCASWRAHSANRYVGPWNAHTDNPILVVGTRFDPNTPFVNAVRAAGRLGNAVLLIHDGYSHISDNDPSTCVKDATGAYFADLVTPPPGTVCPSDHAPFDPDYVPPSS
jgi:pimeloyl-ACP methyl ester carboxylesterase